jgi:hypothetical protein
MAALSSLQLAISKKAVKASPIVHRRNKLVAKIHEQLELCEAKMNGQLYAPKKLRTYINKQTGERMTVEAVKRIDIRITSLHEAALRVIVFWGDLL